MGRNPSTTVLGPETAGVSERQRASHPVLLAVVAVLVLGLAVGWLRYDPIVGGIGSCPEHSERGPLDFSDFDDPIEVCSVTNATSTRVSFGVAARNDGVLPVRVARVRLRDLGDGAFIVDEVRMQPSGGATDHAVSVPFEAFTLGVGQERMLWVSGSLASCEEARRQRVYTIRTLPLRTRLLGLPRDSAAALPNPIRLVIETC